MDPELIKKILAVIASQDEKAALALLPELVTGVASEESAEADPNAATGLAENADAPPVDPNAPPAKASALSKALGFATDAEAAAEIKRLQGVVARQAADTAAVELGARRDLIADLVKLGAEFPSTAWEGKPEDRKPVKRLADESLVDLRSRVALLKASKPKIIEAPSVGADTAGVAAEVAKLSKHQLSAIKASGQTPEQFIAARQNAVRRI